MPSSANGWFRGWAAASLVLLITACGGTAVEPLVPTSSIAAPRGALGDSFVMFSDAQQFPVVNAVAQGGPSERERVREGIRKLAPQLILYGGDAVGFGTYKPFWKEFSRDYRGFTVYPVVGNHDLYGSDDNALAYYFSVGAGHCSSPRVPRCPSALAWHPPPTHITSCAG